VYIESALIYREKRQSLDLPVFYGDALDVTVIPPVLDRDRAIS
jgi:hypothetical protein